jgi:hypothetical protein
MSELRETIAKIISDADFALGTKDGFINADEVADAILAIPEIREGLYLYSRKKVKAGKPSREPTLGHSIGTRR